MWLERLRLYNWRNFRDQVITFKRGINALCGDNGAGKTNCLEAIAYLSRGSSFRSASIDEMRRDQSDHLLLEVIFHNEGVEHRLSLTVEKGATNAAFNGQRIRQWRGLFPTVLWLPQDAELVRGSPLQRRRFLDDHLNQCDPLFSHHFVRFHRFLKQRNHLLKRKRAGELGPWNEAMARAGGYLCSARANLIDQLKGLLADFFSDLGKSEKIDLRYRPALWFSCADKRASMRPTSEEFAIWILKSLDARKQEELVLGTTLFGPHRDDFEVMWNDHRARHFVSNGQAKLCSAGFRVAEWRRLTKMGQRPILLIDEFGSGLDEAHQRGIWGAFSPALQVIAACSTLQKNSLGSLLLSPYHCMRVNNGAFARQSDE